jgi:Leucine-rich repeat (LRR) protein
METSLDLEQRNLVRLEITPEITPSFSTITHVNLNRNYLQNLDFLTCFPNIITLQVKQCKLTQLFTLPPNVTWFKCTRMDLAENSISSLRHLTHHFPNVMDINLSFNCLEEV